MNNRRLVKILADNVEELWYFPQDVTDEQIKESFQRYRDSDYETFEEYLNEENPEMDGERVFVDEILITD